jgi:hypothetical protein
MPLREVWKWNIYVNGNLEEEARGSYEFSTKFPHANSRKCLRKDIFCKSLSDGSQYIL